MCISSIASAQIPVKVVEIADSVRQNISICPNSQIKLLNSETIDIDTNNVAYYFLYELSLKEDISTFFSVYIDLKNSKISSRGAPLVNSKLSPCDILPREQLWKIAKQNGLNTRYKKCSYTIDFFSDEIIIKFHEKKSKSRYYSDVDYYSVNAVTGAFIEHKVITYKN